MKRHILKMLCGVLAAVTLWAPSLWAAFGEDSEKPEPVFTQQERAVIATLIPRGKSTTVEIRFEAAGGVLASVTGVAFITVARPEIDVKDFRSAMYAVTVEGVPVGATAHISARSRYFNSSTRWWVFNEKRAPAWQDAAAENVSLPDRVNELTVTVTDGGPLDSDGATDGRIRMVGGPMDSFWGYALGTLFIRFFGIFLVLGILMLGMMASSRIFQAYEKRLAKPAPPGPVPGAAAAATTAESVPPQHAAAIAVALHRHLSGRRTAGLKAPVGAAEGPAWRIQGRVRTMDARQSVFDHQGFGKERHRK